MSQTLPSLPLFSLTAPDPFFWPLSPDVVTLLYFFSDLELETVPRLLSLSDVQFTSHTLPQVFVLSIYTGETLAEGSFSWVSEKNFGSRVFWTGADGLNSEVCSRYEVSETPTFLVLLGDTVSQRLRTFPEDLITVVPVPPSPPPEEQGYDFASFAQYLRDEEAGEITEVYNRVKENCDFVDSNAAERILEELSQKFKLDLSGAGRSFHIERWGGGDSTDVINPEDITEADFKRRLLAYIQSTLNPASYSGDYSELWSLFRHFSKFASKLTAFLPSPSADKQRILALTTALDEKDAEIARLKQELAQAQTSLLSMPSVLMKTPPPSQPVGMSQALAIPQDEYDFWKYGQDEDWDTPQSHPPKFEEIAAAKGLWIVSAESAGLANTRDLSVKYAKSKSPLRGRNKPPLPPLPDAPKVLYSSHSEGKRLPMPVSKLATKNSLKSSSNKPLDRTFSNAGKLIMGKNGSM